MTFSASFCIGTNPDFSASAFLRMVRRGGFNTDGADYGAIARDTEGYVYRECPFCGHRDYHLTGWIDCCATANLRYQHMSVIDKKDEQAYLHSWLHAQGLTDAWLQSYHWAVALWAVSHPTEAKYPELFKAPKRVYRALEWAKPEIKSLQLSKAERLLRAIQIWLNGDDPWLADFEGPSRSWSQRVIKELQAMESNELRVLINTRPSWASRSWRPRLIEAIGPHRVWNIFGPRIF